MALIIADYDGMCPLCGSHDGTIYLGEDGRYRNFCRHFGCPAYYRHAPKEGYASIYDARNPFESKLLSEGCTVGRYLNGTEAEG